MILRDREDMLVSVQDGLVIKQARTDLGKAQLANAVRFFKALKDTSYVPKLIDYNENCLSYKYQEASAVSDENEARINCIDAMLTLQYRHIIHSDLTGYNYIIRDNSPVIFDWGEARFAWESPTKRNGADTDWFYPSLSIPDTTRIIKRWLAIRERIMDYRGYGKILDLGTLYGDFVALAQSDGFKARGVDAGNFDTECINIAERRWSKYGCEFSRANIIDLDNYSSDITLLLSVWTYIVNDYGEQVAKDFLNEVINSCEFLFFENHTTGDGFVQDYITVDYLRDTLNSMAKTVVPIASFSVDGRNAVRIVWMVSNAK